ncbi:MAG: TonB-dependent receptor [Methylococcaceae bacterium]
MKNIVFILLISSLFLGRLAQANENPAIELDAVEVNAPAEKNSSKLLHPTTVLSNDALRAKIGGTIGETLKNELGISSQSFGTGVGTPVIRGQAGSRVRVQQNGLGNNDVSNLSPDHANSVEPILAERIEVLRGPSTLQYGSGLIGGVVNVIDNRIPEAIPEQLLNSTVEQRFDSASSETASVLKLTGGKNQLAYHLDGFFRSHDAVRIGANAIDENAARATDTSLTNITTLDNPRGLIKNSNGRTFGGSAGLSWIADKALLGAAINHLENNYGIPPDGSGNAPVRINLSQSKVDLKGQLNNPWAYAEALRYKFGYTDYRHDEIDGGAITTTFLNKTYENRLELDHKPIGKFDGIIGFQSVNSQFSALGQETFVPRSDIAAYGVFAVESVKSGAVTYEFGGRVESQSIRPENNRNFAYVPISGSASALWQINSQHQLNLALTHTQRAPQVQELLSNGVHDATRSFEIGNASLGKEFSNNLDLSYLYQASWLKAELNLFHNWINDYIFQGRNGLVFNQDTLLFESLCTSASCIPVRTTSQANAIFKGYEAQLTFPLLENHYGLVDLSLFSDYTRAEFVNGGDVPRIPPLRYGLQLSYDNNALSSNIRLTRGEAQTHVGANETSTPSYLLLNLNTQYRIASYKQTEITLFANGKNLLNDNIRNATSFLRNFAPEAGRSGELGIRVSY